MLNHHLQRAIVYKLAFLDRARFSDLQPDDIENKLFTYHLQKTISSGLVEKSEDGLYTLSAAGRRYSTGALEKEKDLIVQRAHSVLFAVIRRKADGAYLLYERGTHPLRGYQGFMHCNPVAELTAEEAAQHQVLERTGLNGTFTALGGGFFRMYTDDHIESYVNFTLLYCDDINGTLTPKDDKASYWWTTKIDTTAAHVLPGTQELLKLYQARKPFFIDRSYSL